LEDCERQWKAESAELKDSAKKLQQQNEKLENLLTERSMCSKASGGNYIE